MSDILSAQHPPALRVGGRRLSISARPKPHNAPGTSSAPAPNPAEDADYPRPAAQGDGDDQAQHPPPHNEEEAPKKEKHGHGSHDKNRLKESVYRKVDATTPSKDHLGAKQGFGAAGRIGQPMGKVLGV
ncbi:hypothetical protein OG21DRAFT_1517244 [Imleria badia]|nr:hypothetical protein OG21DRAFT_1517244 [Imleria badia]